MTMRLLGSFLGEVLRAAVMSSDQNEYMQDLKDRAKSDAEERTKYEQQRIFSYEKLRHSYSPWNVDAYYTDLLKRRSVTYRPKRNPSKNAARRDAKIGPISWLISRFNQDKKTKIDKVIKESQEQLQKETDEENRREYERCQQVNIRAKQRTDKQYDLFKKGDLTEVYEYFSAVVSNDDYSVDYRQHYYFSFNLDYDPKLKRILIDYRIPRIYEISDIKEWKCTKDLEVVPTHMSKKDFLPLYERILFDLVVRTTALIFDSDNMDVVSEVLFNAFTVYDEAPDRNTFLLSVIIPKNAYLRQDIKNYGFMSKQFISQMKQVRYLDDIHDDNPPSILADRPPIKQVIPIRTLLHD